MRNSLHRMFDCLSAWFLIGFCLFLWFLLLSVVLECVLFWWVTYVKQYILSSILRRRCQIRESATWWHVSRKPLERKLPPRIKVMLRHLTHLRSKAEAQPYCWSSPWSNWTGGWRRRQRRQMDKVEDKAKEEADWIRNRRRRSWRRKSRERRSRWEDQR